MMLLLFSFIRLAFQLHRVLPVDCCGYVSPLFLWPLLSAVSSFYSSVGISVLPCLSDYFLLGRCSRVNTTQPNYFTSTWIMHASNQCYIEFPTNFHFRWNDNSNKFILSFFIPGNTPFLFDVGFRYWMALEQITTINNVRYLPTSIFLTLNAWIAKNQLICFSPISVFTIIVYLHIMSIQKMFLHVYVYIRYACAVRQYAIGGVCSLLCWV